ncbi:catechol 1,2-dioxygenase [Methylobacterium indicum]|uniref:catechol 1,2-dioxygenase n=1 Tax=Methylobacterium indicum TaxID=1775910 RepID=A0A8H8WNY6_9HYPH|nr:catechol 1,2-dioxygenase [Methylobacterium indicum]BCM81670.1 catechol 1,2-dioxygenase [Methylobacterium indicum]
MTDSLMQRGDVKALLDKAAGLDNDTGDRRLKQIVRRVLSDAFATIEAFQVTPTEFWRAVDYVTRLGQSNEAGLLVAGLGLEHFLDILLDEEERKAGLEGGTPRTIEGPLWLAGAPLAQGEARLDQDPEPDAETIVMTGQVRDPDGNPVPGAVVDVWHANTKGGYSFFDSSQSAWNLRRRIRTDGDGRYAFRSIMPVGYGCPPDGTTQELLDRLGRHGQRPAHIHFFVEAPGYRKLTTQINIAGDRYLHEDFAFATRDELIVEARRETAPEEIARRGLSGPFSTLTFDFTLNREADHLPETVVLRAHATAA